VPYGYKYVLAGRYTVRDVDKRKELYDYAINEEEAEAVRLMFQLAIDKGWGGNRIAQHLNKQGIFTRNGKNWQATTINTLLNRPIYKGYMSYGKTTRKLGSQRRLPKDEWTLSNEANKKQNPNYEPVEQDSNIPTKSKLYLTGFIRCGVCGTALTTIHNQKVYKKKDGSETVKKRLQYGCCGKKLGKNCEGPTGIARDKIEIPVIEHVKAYLSQIQSHDFTAEIEKQKRDSIKDFQKKVNDLQRKQAQLERDVADLENEILKVVRNESSFTVERLNSLISKKEIEIKGINEELHQAEAETEAKKVEASDLAAVRNVLPKWGQLFEEADYNKKKTMLAMLIDNVIVYPGKIEVKVKMHIQQFLGACLGEQLWGSI
jgi:predicted transcriptional regulator